MNKRDIALSRAKIGLISRKDSVFITTVLFSLSLRWSTNIPTAATNGTELLLNEDFFMELPPAQREFLLAHEAWHVCLEHMIRIGNLDPKRYNKAGDYVINLILTKAGLEMIPCGLLDKAFKGMSTQEVYDLLPVEEDDPFQCDVLPLEDCEDSTIEQKEMEVTNIVMRAVAQSKMSSDSVGTVPGDIERMINEIINPKLPWQTLLQNYVSALAKQDYSWRKPNRRYFPSAYLPKLYSDSVDNIAIAIDTSGSVSQEDFSTFISEIEGIREILNPETTTIIDFDSQIKAIHKITRDDNLRDIPFKGYGGTDLRPMMKEVIKLDPTVLIVFSDLYCTPILEDTNIPTIWICISHPKAKVNFGELIHFDP
jgi:predicted metal-dependent peptidase